LKNHDLAIILHPLMIKSVTDLDESIYLIMHFNHFDDAIILLKNFIFISPIFFCRLKIIDQITQINYDQPTHLYISNTKINVTT
jgi:hypothetical protein